MLRIIRGFYMWVIFGMKGGEMRRGGQIFDDELGENRTK